MKDVVDAIELRGVVEGTAARLAAERGMDAELAEDCRNCLRSLDTAVFDGALDFPAYVAGNAEFHSLLNRLSASPIIAREAERISKLPLASPSSFLTGQEFVQDFKRSLELAQTQHWAIFEAIEAREGARADALAREHARLARKNLDYVISRKAEFVDKVPGLALIAEIT